MRIVHVVRSDAFAGVERYVCEVANRLQQRGHDLLVVGGEPQRMRRELVPDIAWSPGASVAAAAFSLSRGGLQDVVHVHMTAAETAGVLARPVHGAALVTTRHFAGARGSSPIARLVGQGISAALSSQISISEFVAESIDEPSTVLRNAVAAAPQAALRSKTAVMMQRLEPEKAPDVAIRAWAASSLPEHGWTLRIAGRGQLESEIRTLIRDLGVQSSAEVLGQVTGTEELLAEASVLIAPAPAEPFGLSVVEAMAHGVPVVGAAGGAHLETIGTKDLLFQPGDVRGCAALLDRLGRDEDERRRLGVLLRDRQRQFFELEGHVDALCLLYEGVVARRRGRRTGATGARRPSSTSSTDTPLRE
jgi:glycosyltransferase involved in cell wall biosynthesis